MELIPKTDALSSDAHRAVDDGCSRAIAACIDMMDAAAALGVSPELSAAHDALLHLYAVSTLMLEGHVQMPLH